VTTAVLSKFSQLMLFDWKVERAHPLYLMNTSTSWKCFDPRDRVFALLGDIDDGRVRPDYTKSLEEVYLGATQFLISFEAPLLWGPLSVLSSAGLTNRHEQNDLDIPSWIVDWRCNLKNILPGRKYCADFGRTPNISFAEDNITLEVSGVCVDTVLATKDLRVGVEHLIKDGSRWDTLEQGFALWQEHFDFYPNNYDAQEIWIRTPTLDTEPDATPTRRLPYNHTPEYKKLWSAKFDPQRNDPKELFPMGDRDPNNYDKWAADLMYRFDRALVEELKIRTFFITQSGYMGLGPRGMKVGDRISIIFGCTTPMVLRQEQGHHVLFGDCFVGGIMDGEAVKSSEKQRERRL